jgi:hypothetical protein
MNYKGSFVNQGVEYAVGLMIIGIVGGASAIALNSFATGQTGVTATIINNSLNGVSNFTTQLPVVGTIAGVGLVLLVVIGAVGFFLYKSQ